MDVGSARAQLTFMLAADSAPAITGAQIDLLLTQAERQDKYGRYPSDAAWITTWDLHSAACEGWRWKAAVLATQTDIGSDSVRISRSQAYTHAMKMVDMYRRRIRAASIRVLGETSDVFDRAQAVFDLSTLGN